MKIRPDSAAVQRGLVVALASALAASLALATGEGGTPAGAASLRASYQAMRDQMAHSALGRPLLLSSGESADGLQGDVYATVDDPLPQIGTALDQPAQWCDLLTLHLNNRRCRVSPGSGAQGGKPLITLSVVRRYDKPVDQAFELQFVYRVLDATPQHLSIELTAANGPLGTYGYRVALEAVALDERHSFVHFGYAYHHNAMASMATDAYLSTFGSGKVGFTVTGKDAAGQPEYIAGPRGLVERNAMRYFLALEAYLGALETPPARQLAQRERLWFDATERYPRQLHEVDWPTYLALKRADRERDAAAAPR